MSKERRNVGESYPNSAKREKNSAQSVSPKTMYQCQQKIVTALVGVRQIGRYVFPLSAEASLGSSDRI